MNRLSTVCARLTVGVIIILSVACRRSDQDMHPIAALTHSGSDWFVDRARDSGIDFVHFNGMSGQFYYPELFGPGVALLDYDNDGDLDLFVAQGQMLGGQPIESATFAPKDPGQLSGRLYRNDLAIHAGGSRTLHFTDVTAASGIQTQAYGMGAAVGDFNNDGCADLLVTGLDRVQLFRNNCNGTFTDITTESGLKDPAWSVSAGFLDYDRDGWLDLFIGNYVNWTVGSDEHCFGMAGSRVYCPPATYRPARSLLFHNNGNGTFSDVTDQALRGGDFGPALGVGTADMNGDGWIDFYVANDSQADELWINQHDGTFTNTALVSSAAFNADGRPTASMGVDAADIDNDGDEDIIHTNLIGEGDTLLMNDGRAVFLDLAKSFGLYLPSLKHTGFGAAWLDFDNDGWLDLLTVNGAVRILEEGEARIKDVFPYRERKQLFRNLGNGRFEDVTNSAGVAFQSTEVGRGAAFGDVDNDGDTDAVVGTNSGAVELLVNNVGNRQHWLGLRLEDATTTRDMLGARVSVVRRGLPTLARRVRSDGSYASANDPRILVGLGNSPEQPSVRVIWPNGATEQWDHLPIDRYSVLKRGTAK